MAKFVLTVTDAKDSDTGGYIKVIFDLDPPLGPNNLNPDGRLDPKKCTIAQCLANDIGLLIQRQQCPDLKEAK